VHSLGVKNLTSRLHSSTFWEQLHTTVRQENILKKLAGPPIRPRPRPAKSQGKAWKLVRGALQKKRRDRDENWRRKNKNKIDGGNNDGGMRRGGSEGSLATLEATHMGNHRRDASFDSEGSDHRPSLMHVQFTDYADANGHNDGNSLDLPPVAEGADQGAVHADQSSAHSSDGEREGSSSDGGGSGTAW
jgi:hypothetical protein